MQGVAHGGRVRAEKINRPFLRALPARSKDAQGCAIQAAAADIGQGRMPMCTATKAGAALRDGVITVRFVIAPGKALPGPAGTQPRYVFPFRLGRRGACPAHGSSPSRHPRSRR